MVPWAGLHCVILAFPAFPDHTHSFGQFNFTQVAQWATIAQLGASIVVGDTIIYDAQRQVTLNLKQ